MNVGIARGALAGVVSGLLCLVLLVRVTLELDVRLLTADALLPAVVFFAAVAAAAVTGWRVRPEGGRGSGRGVVLACGMAVGGLALLSVGLAVALGTGVENELAELSAILVGAVLGAWGQATLAGVLAAGNGQRGQTASEYLGLILVVSVIIAALSSLGPAITQLVRATLDTVESGQGLQTGRGEPAAAPQRKEGKGAASSSAARGGASAPVVRPLTQENAGRPWERIGVSEEESKQLEKVILDEVNPGALERLLVGPGAGGVTLDENGELRVVLSRDMVSVVDGKLKAVELLEAGVGGGLAKALLKVAGASGTRTLAKALTKLPPGLRERFGRLGIVPGVKNPPTLGAARGVPHAIPESRLRHVFRDAPGHLPDTPANRKLLQGVADDPATTLGADKFGNTWSARTLDDGTQAWAQTRNGDIINGGLNPAPRPFNPQTGLSRQQPPRSR